MNSMRIFLFVVVCAIMSLCAFSVAQAPPLGAAAFIDSNGRTSVVASTEIGTLRDLAGRRGLTASILAFAGMETAPQRPVAGFALGIDLRAASNATLQIGPGILYADGRIRDVGVYAGFRLRF